MLGSFAVFVLFVCFCCVNFWTKLEKVRFDIILLSPYSSERLEVPAH